MNRLLTTASTLLLLAGCASAPSRTAEPTAAQNLDQARSAVPVALAQDRTYLDNLGAIDTFRVQQSHLQQPLSEPAFDSKGTQCPGFAQPLPAGWTCP